MSLLNFTLPLEFTDQHPAHFHHAMQIHVSRKARHPKFPESILLLRVLPHSSARLVYVRGAFPTPASACCSPHRSRACLESRPSYRYLLHRHPGKLNINNGCCSEMQGDSRGASGVCVNSRVIRAAAAAHRARSEASHTKLARARGPIPGPGPGPGRPLTHRP